MSVLSSLRRLTAADQPLASTEAFSLFYEQTQRSVFRYIYALAGDAADRSEVEDLTAEVFMRAWRQRQRFKGTHEAALGWVLRIAQHLVIDTRRREKRFPQAAVSAVSAADAPDPAVEVLAREQQAILRSLLTRLPLEQQEILVLRYVLGWRVNEIARYMTKNEGTISVSIHRALARLRVLWPQTVQEGE